MLIEASDCRNLCLRGLRIDYGVESEEAPMGPCRRRSPWFHAPLALVLNAPLPDMRSVNHLEPRALSAEDIFSQAILPDSLCRRFVATTTKPHPPHELHVLSINVVVHAGPDAGSRVMPDAGMNARMGCLAAVAVSRVAAHRRP